MLGNCEDVCLNAFVFDLFESFEFECERVEFNETVFGLENLGILEYFFRSSNEISNRLLASFCKKEESSDIIFKIKIVFFLIIIGLFLLVFKDRLVINFAYICKFVDFWFCNSEFIEKF